MTHATQLALRAALAAGIEGPPPGPGLYLRVSLVETFAHAGVLVSRTLLTDGPRCDGLLLYQEQHERHLPLLPEVMP